MKFLSEIDDAEKVKIADAAGNFTSNNVEGALAELGSFTSGIAAGATKNDTDANLKARANHTGTQTASTISDFANAVRSTVLTGLSTTSNAVITVTDTVLSALGKLQKQISDNLASLTSHTGSTSNPHSVTKSQVGLGSVDNTSDANKPISNATLTALNGKVDNSRVLTDVPLGAKFTDTIYTHPTNHPASMITGLPTSLPANGGDADTSRHLIGDDTRNVNSNPSEYMNGGSRFAARAGWQTEFKLISTMGLTGLLSGAYCYLQTHTPWSDPSGGYPIQIAYGNGIPCWRVGISTTAWSAWQKMSDGGNADTVNGFTVGVSVPAGAKFTDNDTITTINGKTGAISKADIVALGIPAQDTVYNHPSSHPASIITESTTKRFVSDAEKTLWNSKSEFSGNYNDLSNKPIIPSTTSQLTNNSGYITISDIPDAPPSIQVGGGKPTDGSMWYEVI